MRRSVSRHLWLQCRMPNRKSFADVHVLRWLYWQFHDRLLSATEYVTVHFDTFQREIEIEPDSFPYLIDSLVKHYDRHLTLGI